MSKQAFTPDELRVVMKWAVAYLDARHHADKIGADTMFPKEIDRLEAKVREAAPEVLLGMLNSCFLLGFKSMDGAYPLQEVWDKLGLFDGVTYLHSRKEEAAETLQAFLEKAGLIKEGAAHG